MSDSLSAEHFGDFYRAMHGHQPFAWQVDLLHQVVADGRWPGLIDLPTGAGKTSVLDIAMFHLAMEAERPAASRRAPLRIAFVVDRRIVVDQVGQRAEQLVHQLTGSNDEVLARVAGALTSLSGDGPPLRFSALRGGIVRDEAWANRPDVPAVLSSTVDQVGSRLLFRGYGLSDRMSPIHAGLLANDTILFLDEVHLSQPFAQTLAMLNEFRLNQGRPLQVVELSATPGQRRGTVFPSQPLKSDEVDGPLKQRLIASKPCRLQAVKVPKDRLKGDLAFTKAVVKATKAAVKDHPDRLIGVVVNRVDTARRVFNELANLPDAAAVLLTGRMRPIDRDEVLRQHADGWTDRSKRTDHTQIVVATQCIEAGADFDFDLLITESASIDALRQRFGRLDRRGDVHATGEPLESVILNRGDKPELDDPVYGAALGETWLWLCELAHVDFGIERLPEPPSECVAERPDAPLLTELHVQDFAQTSPRPQMDQDPARWLHGPEPSTPSVSVLWRNELNDLADLAASEELLPEVENDVVEEATARLSFFPPSMLETVELPLWAARRWLSEDVDVSFADAGSAADEEQKLPQDPMVLVWRDSAASLRQVSRLRPGDVVALPTSYGGIGPHLNWDPESRSDVSDLADAAARQGRRQRLVRLGADYGDEAHRDAFTRLAAQAIDEPLTNARLRDDLDGNLSGEPIPSSGLRTIFRFTNPGDPEQNPNLWFVGLLHPLASDSSSADIDDLDDQPSFTAPPKPVLLDAHLRGVGAIAASFGQRLGLDEDVIADLGLAGRLHDLGKADPRFQRWLKEGADLPNATALLAKSSTSSRNWAAMRAARERSGYPPGMRHELLSLALAQSHSDLWATARNPDLVAHLVLSHHGYCRPLAPPVVDYSPQVVALEVEGHELSASSDTGLTRVGSGVVDRFWRLVDQFDPYGLAYLEAVLRLADHWRSAQEASGEVGNDKGEAP